MQLDFFYHNRTPSYASMSTISGHDDCICRGGSRISGRGGVITIFTSGGEYGRGRVPSRSS